MKFKNLEWETVGEIWTRILRKNKKHDRDQRNRYFECLHIIESTMTNLAWGGTPLLSKTKTHDEMKKIKNLCVIH